MKKINPYDLNSKSTTESSLRGIACNVIYCSPQCYSQCRGTVDGIALSTLDARIGYSAQGGESSM